MALAATGKRPVHISKYDVIEEIGHGGMATVYRAKDPRLDREVAIKVIHPHLRDSPEVAHRFVVEAQAVAKLRHANIVEVFDVSGEKDEEQYLVVELLRGRTLRTILREHDGILPPEVASAIAMELLSALAHAHAQGVVHRDIKPENVIIEHVTDDAPKSGGASPGSRVKVKLTDFGIAKLLDAKGVTSTGQVLGSPAHMSPEQIEGADVDARSDVFGLGVLMYECMVGHLPFEGTNPAQVLRRVLDGAYVPGELDMPTVGKRWSTILDRALAHNPAHRYTNTTDMRDALIEEQKRLGFAEGHAEIEAFLDDPADYVAVHDKEMVGKLVALGARGRKAKDLMGAAADYNRALAYAPNDPALMRVVAGMNRAEARARFIRRIAPPVVGAIALGAVAFFVTNHFRQKTVVDPVASIVPTASVVPTASSSPSASVAVTPSATASASTTAQVVRPVASASTVIPTAVSRTVRFRWGKTTPSNILASVDQDPPADINSASTLTLDGRDHTILFHCPQVNSKDICNADVRQVSAGRDDVTTMVDLKVIPATLVVIGDPTAQYGIEEEPLIKVVPQTGVSIPMQSHKRMITVLDRTHDVRKPIEVHANESMKVIFQ